MPRRSGGVRRRKVDRVRSTPPAARQLAGSWGAFDHNQIERESARHGIADPLAGLGLEHFNLKRAFAKARSNIRQVGMLKALEIAGLALESEHHRALDDALNITRWRTHRR